MKLKRALSFLLSFCLVFTGTMILGSENVSADVYAESFCVQTDSVVLDAGDSTYVEVVWLENCTLVIDTDNENMVSVKWYEDKNEDDFVKITAKKNAKGKCTVKVYNDNNPDDCININVTVNTNEITEDPSNPFEDPSSKVTFEYKKSDAFDYGYEVEYSYYEKEDLPKVYFRKAILTDNTAAAKKINAAIEKDCKKFLTSEEIDNVYGASFEYPPQYGDKYFYYVDSKVTYNNNYVISIKYTEKSYAGGAANTTVYGRTYSLKTGDRLYLGNVTNLSLGKIKKQLNSKVKKSYGNMAAKRIKKIKSKKSLNFYLVPGKKAYITFKPYELQQGGSSVVFKIKSKYF